jgi:sucrose phosphorylase
MSPTCAELLDRLYDRHTAAQTARKLAELLDHWRPEMPTAVRTSSPLSERDVLLIAYADQVRDGARAPLQVLADFASQHLAGIVSGIHLLPFYPWSSDDGFSVKDYFAVDPAVGGWPDIARLSERFELMFDGVFNHLSAQSDWFQRFLADDPAYREFFVSVKGMPDLSQVVRPRALPLLTEFASKTGPRHVWTTFSADHVDLNFQNPALLLRTTEALLFYVARGARFIRLDAIAFLWKEPGTTCLHRPQTHAVIQLWRAVLNEVAPGVRLITETNVPHGDNVSYFGDGTNEAQLVYNFALPPLVLHSFATGNAEKLVGWAQSLRLPSNQVAFFNFLASHDGIGLNPARGILSEGEIEALVARTQAHRGFISYKHLPDGSRAPYEMNINYLDALSNPAAGEPDELAARRLLTAHALLLSLPGVPGIYFHSLFGSRGDQPGAAASGIPRRINREKLERGRLEAELTEASTLRGRVFSGLSEWLRRRAATPAFAPDAPAEVLARDPRVVTIRRYSPSGRTRILCLHNVSAERICLRELIPSLPEGSLDAYGSRWVAEA